MPIPEKSKEELQELARELGIYGYKKLSKTELVAAIINAQNQKENKEEKSNKSLWKKYASHIYGLASIIGLFIAVISFFPSKHPDAKRNSSNSESKVESIKPDNSIAILPFSDMSPDKDQEYFGDGIAEEILNTLTKLTELKVSGRTSSFSFKDKDLTINEIGEKLNVKYILEGSIRMSQDRIRITAQLIETTTGYHLWSETFNRDFLDVFEIQDELSEKIGSLILGELTPGQIDRITNNNKIDPKAFALYLDAKSQHMLRFYPLRTIKDFKESEDKFKKAIDLEPNYALAHAGLADLYDSRANEEKDSLIRARYEEKSRLTIKKAIELNPNLPYVQLVKGWTYIWKKSREDDYDSAFDCFLKAYQLDKRNTEGLFGLGVLYRHFSLYEDVLQIFDRALKLNPNNSQFYWNLADYHRNFGNYNEALNICKIGIQVSPKDIALYDLLLKIYIYKKEYKLASETCGKIESMNPEHLNTPRKKILKAISEQDFKLALQLDPNSFYVLYATDQQEKLDSIRLSKLPRYHYKERSRYRYLLNHPSWDNIRDNPDFQKTLEINRINYEKALKRFPRAETFL